MNQVDAKVEHEQVYSANDDDDDDNFDEMLMIDGHDMLLSPPHQSALHDTESLSPDHEDFHWRLSNGVHMELQENAKLPTLQWNVNRTGSSTTSKFDVQQFIATTTASTNDRRKSRSNTIDGDDLSFIDADATSVNLEDYLQIGDDTVIASKKEQQLPSLNLTEIFLTSEMGQRHSNFPTHKNSRYDVNVPLEPNAATTLTASQNSDSNNIMEVDIDPTPLSEIKRKLSLSNVGTKLESGHGRQQSFTDTTATPTTYVPYWSRREQLPIPSPIPSPMAVTEENGIHNYGDSKATTSNASNSNPGVSALATIPTTITRTNTGLSQTKLIGSWKTQEPQHSTIHSISRPAVQDASQKRTQYGFGRKHVVPSVPTNTTTMTTAGTKGKRGTPTNHKTATKSFSRSNSQRSQASAATSHTTSLTDPANGSSRSNGTTRAPSVMSHDDDDSGSGDGGNCALSGNVAYERKKERAKNARIRLNESIDRLQIALNMAGTQSNQRLAMFQENTIPYRIISDCVKFSEDAKKWDRPSFVGSAATMIQGLNAQCEALVRALHDERHARAEQTAGNTSTSIAVAAALFNNDLDLSSSSGAIAPIKKGDLSPSTVGVKHGYSNDQQNHYPSIDTSNNSIESPKRRKIDDDEHDCNLASGTLPSLTTVPNAEVDASRYSKLHSGVFTDKSILDRVASFLDPLSLLLCKRVSRDWKNGGVFTSDVLWQRLAVDRFGFYNVRQWSAKVEDFAHKDIHSATNLFKTLDATNIMPHCRLDGMLLLGESRLLGKVSAWTYLVERSNGETMRSVERHSSMPGTGMYTSLPIVQLRTIIQNTGIHDDVVVIREQAVTVDASTRRRGDEMGEIDWDDRFRKRILNLDGSVYVPKVPCDRTSQSIYRELCRLRLFEAVVLETNIHARGCVTTSKFVQKSNFTKFLVQIRDGTTVPLVIPFPRDASHLLP